MKKNGVPVVIAVVVILVDLLLNNPSEMMGQYMNVEEYLLLQADNKKTESLAVWEIPYVVMADEPVEVAVIDRKQEYLEHHEEFDESTAGGTLETWGYNWLIKTDASKAPPVILCIKRQRHGRRRIFLAKHRHGGFRPTVSRR